MPTLAATACTSHADAADIMGSRYISLVDALGPVGVKIPRDDAVTLLNPIPYKPDILHALRYSHLLVPMLPVPIRFFPLYAQPLFAQHPAAKPWYARETFVREHIATGWRLIRLGHHPGTSGRSLAAQTRLLSDQEVVPTAAELMYTILVSYMCRRLRPPLDHLTRVSGLDSANRLLEVAVLRATGTTPFTLHVFAADSHDGRLNTGLASMRLPTDAPTP